MTTKSSEKHLTKKELSSAFWRSFLVTACFSMDRMQAPGFDYAMIPVLKKLWVLKMGDITFNVQTDLLDAICPKILPLLLTFSCYKALQKKVNPAIIMVLILALGVILKAFNII